MIGSASDKSYAWSGAS